MNSQNKDCRINYYRRKDNRIIRGSWVNFIKVTLITTSWKSLNLFRNTVMKLKTNWKEWRNTVLWWRKTLDQESKVVLMLRSSKFKESCQPLKEVKGQLKTNIWKVSILERLSSTKNRPLHIINKFEKEYNTYNISKNCPKSKTKQKPKIRSFFPKEKRMFRAFIEWNGNRILYIVIEDIIRLISAALRRAAKGQEESWTI